MDEEKKSKGLNITVFGYGVLSPFEELFCQAKVCGASHKDAVFLALAQADPGKEDDITPKKAVEKASRLLAMPRIKHRMEEITRENQQMVQWTREDSIKVLASIALGRVGGTKVPDRVNSVKALNAMHGWETKVVDHKSSDGTMSPVAILPEKRPDGE